jgi:predicted metal-binding membrane protein
VWVVYGAAAYPLGVTLGAAEMQWPTLARFVPVATGVAIFLAGMVQLTPWKTRQLRHCRDAASCRHLLAPDSETAWRHGIRLGVHCSLCCSGFILVLLVAGVMDLWAMAVVGTAIAAERLAPWPRQVARAAGLAIMAIGALIIVQASL